MPKPIRVPDPKNGMVANLALQIRLLGRLMLDRRVNLFLKLIPLASLAYLINPVDLPTPLDDIGVLWLGITVFVELCPPEVVEEHINNLQRVVSGKSRNPSSQDQDQVIDAEFRRVPSDEEDDDDSKPHA
jgi:hypothetical protein